MILKRSIAYTANWLHTIILASMLAIMIVFLLIFLQPFDTYSQEIPYKNVKLVGYGICIIIPILIVHIFEEIWFRYKRGKWYLYEEITVLFFGFLFIATAACLYNTIIINGLDVDAKYILKWAIDFGLPFAPILIPAWAYLRFRFSEIRIKPFVTHNDPDISIKGKNQNEEVQFLEKEFIMAKAQANYVDVYYLKNGHLEKKMIRSTLSSIMENITFAEQIHRSYLVNPAQIKGISGNTRQATIILNYIDDEIPISSKHFLALKKHLQNRP